MKKLLWLVFLLLSTKAWATDSYIRDVAHGSANCTSLADACSGQTAANWQTAWNLLTDGGTLYVGNGTYTLTTAPLSITTQGGTSDYKTIKGVIDGTTTEATGDSRPLIDGDWVYTSPSSQDRFMTASASQNYIKLQSLRFTDWKSLFSNEFSAGKNKHLKFIDVDIDGSREPFFLIGNTACGNGIPGSSACPQVEFDAGTQDIEWTRVNMFHVTKNGVKMRYGVHTFTATDVDTSGGGETYDTDDGRTGWNIGDFSGGDSPDRSGTFTRCIFRDFRRVRGSGYTQGDGIAFEGHTTDLTFTDCIFMDNTDGGFDGKGSNITFTDCIFLRNKRNARMWGSGSGLPGTKTFNNCLFAYAKRYSGEVNSVVDFWITGNPTTPPTVTLNYCTLINFTGAAGTSTYLFELDNGNGNATVVVNNSIYAIDGNSIASGNDTTNTSINSGMTLTLNSTVLYDANGSVTSGTNPQFVNPANSTMTDFSTDFNNVLYGGPSVKGYFFLGTTPPVDPVEIGVSNITLSNLTYSQ